MYNGIGLTTPRGSGTNGYVQKNLAFITTFKDKPQYKTDDDIKRADAAFFKEPNKEILEHERKRKVEVKCFEMELTMEEQGYTESEIRDKVAVFRTQLLKEMNTEMKKKASVHMEPFADVQSETGRLVPKGTHEIAAVSVLKNTVFKEALGIGSDFQDGNSLELVRTRKNEEIETKRLLEAQKKMKTMDSSDEESDKEQKKSSHRKPKEKKRRRRSPSASSSESGDSSHESNHKHRKRKHRSSEKSHSRKHKHSHSSDRRRRDH